MIRLNMKYGKTLIAIILVALVFILFAIFVQLSVSKWGSGLIEKNKTLCMTYAEELRDGSEEVIVHLGLQGLLTADDLSSSQVRLVDSLLKSASEEQLVLHNGLDGGFYLSSVHSFFGYSFPTSPPPVPAYGPPPRSFEIIRSQCIATIESEIPIVEVHGFDPALFPLATIPIVYESEIVGSVWVRIHLERNMPIVKISRIINRTAVLALTGLFIFLIIAAIFRGEIQGIKSELVNIRHDPGYRMKRRWGMFGYISATINDMLSTIEKENKRRQKLERELNQKNKMAALGTMVAGVVHEVKTPLSIIKTRLQIWDRAISTEAEGCGPVSRDSLQMLVNETDRLSALVNRLLVFSRPIEQKFKQTDMNLLISEVVSFISINTVGKGIEIRTRMNPDLPLIMADQSTLKQVFLNILQNSCESMPDGGLIEVCSDLISSDGCIIITVLDSGSGIPEDALGNIYDPFFSLKDTGAGLGLAISYQIVKAHNGEISITNRVEGGARCTIKLPVNQ